MTVTQTSDILIPRRLTGPLRDRHVMPSGRTITVDSDTEEIRVVGVDGDLEVRIRLTDEGPVITTRAAKMRLEAEDSVDVRCRSFSVEAERSVELHSGGEVRVKSSDDAFVDADHVQLNCGDRTGYHDDPARAAADDVTDPTA